MSVFLRSGPKTLFTSRISGHLRSRTSVVIRAEKKVGEYDPTKARETIAQRKKEREQRRWDNSIIIGGGVALTLLTLSAVKGFPALQDALYDSDVGSFGLIGPWDVMAGAMWTFSLWYVSPLQLLLLFLGKIETERPSDWLIAQLTGSNPADVGAGGEDTPTWATAVTIGICALGGFGFSVGCGALLEDPTWALSSGIASLMAAGVYEIGRPKRLSKEEAVQLEGQWQDFSRWADKRIVNTGRCHESEVCNAFRKEVPRYRSRDLLDDDKIRDMVREWYRPGKVERTGSGYYKGLSLRARVDPFTGAVTGGSTAVAVGAAKAGGASVGEDEPGMVGGAPQQPPAAPAAEGGASAPAPPPAASVSEAR